MVGPVIGGTVTPFFLTIDRLNPPVPIENRPVQIFFSLTNQFGGNPTSGIVTGTSGGQYQVAHIALGATITGSVTSIAPRAGTSVELDLQYYDKDAPIVAEFRQPSAEASITVDVAAKYMVNLDNFQIVHTRSINEDTDYVGFTAQVANPPFPPNQDGYQNTVYIGNVNDGVHPVNLQAGPFIVAPNDHLMLTYVITNTGYTASHQQGLQQVSDLISQAARAVLTAVYPEDAGVWTIADDFTRKLNAIFATNCDGVVAADQVIVTGTTLNQWTATSDNFPSSKEFTKASPTFCGDHDQDYIVNWSVTRLTHD